MKKNSKTRVLVKVFRPNDYERFRISCSVCSFITYSPEFIYAIRDAEEHYVECKAILLEDIKKLNEFAESDGVSVTAVADKLDKLILLHS